MIFNSCKKEDSPIGFSDNTSPNIYNIWQLSMQISSLGNGDIYTNGMFIDSLSGTIYIGLINSVNSSSIIISSDTIFTGLSTIYSSRVWSINQNQLIIETYYDSNGFAYNILEHNFTKNSDTLVVNFQSGDIKTFIINELTTDNLHITSVPDANSLPVFDANGIYQDTVLMNITSDEYAFDINVK